MIAALLKEIDIQANYLENEAVETIYLGGGTPSLLAANEITSLLETINGRYNVLPDAEITLESNPDDISIEKLLSWKTSGINRLSIGIQSFYEEDLLWMNRAHTAMEAAESLMLARQYFDNITIDLIYGTPGLTNEKWKNNVEAVLANNIQHISCYALTVEQKTPLQKLISTGKYANVNPDKQSEQFLLLMDWLSQAGYEHYEISNFAKPGFRSRHNSSYWRGQRYLGLGPSAHSFNGTSRQWNVANNQQYIEEIGKGIIPFEIEQLTRNQQLNEYIMTSLRTMEGLSLDFVKTKFGAAAGDRLYNQSKKYVAGNTMMLDGDYLRLTNEGKLLADGIASDLFDI